MVDNNKHLVPVFIIYADGVRLDTEHEGAVKRIRVSDCLDGIGRCIIEFAHPAAALLDKGAIALESAVDVHLGYKDDCAKVFGGEVTGFEYGYSEHSGEVLRVTVSGRLHRLRNAVRSMSYERKTDGGFIMDMLDRYGLKADMEDFGPEADVAVHHLESDWDFLLERAKRYGRSVYEWEGTVYVRNEITVAKDDIVLEFGKSIISFHVKESLSEQVAKCTFTGWNMMKCEGVTGSATLDEVPVKVGGNRSWADEARILPGKWESVVDSQGVSDAEDARNRALGELQNASMEWQRAEVKCEGLYQAHPGMRATLKYVGERFSGEYVIERVNHEFDVNGFITELHLRRNMLPGEVRRASAIDDERGQQHNGGNNNTSEETSQEDAEEQEEERNPSVTNAQWKNADGQSITKAFVGDEVLLCAEVQDIADGASAKIKVVEKDADGNDDVATLNAAVKDGKIECKWKVVYTEDDDDADSEQEKAEKGYTLPEYAFTVECDGATSEESGILEIKEWISSVIRDENKNILANNDYILLRSDGTKIIEKTNTKGLVSEDDLEFGAYYIGFGLGDAIDG